MTQDDRTTEEARIRGVIDAWARAISDKDAQGVIGRQAEPFVDFSLAPPLKGEGADPEGLEAWFATWRGPIGYAVGDQVLAVGGDVAFAHGLAHMTGTKTDGARPDLWFRQTLGLRRIAGSWKIVHQHASVPFYMDGSFRAAVDLRP